MQGLDATCVLGTVSPVTSSPAPWLPARSPSQHQQRTALSRRQGAAITISERQKEFRIGKYPSKTAQRDISHLPPRSAVSRCLPDHRTGCSQRSEAPVQVTATSLPTPTLSLCGSCCSGEVNSTGPGAVPALPRQSFPQDSSKALHKDKDSKQAESCVGWNHPIAEEPGQRGK